IPAWLWIAAGSMVVLILVAVGLAAALSRDGKSTPTPVITATTAAPGATPTTPPVVIAKDTATSQPTATWTSTPVWSDTPTPAPATDTPVPTRPLTATPTPRPLTATPTPRPKLTATPTPRPTATPTAAPKATGLPAPVLVSPWEGVKVTDQATFAWNWSGPALAANQGFEVRLWRDGQPDHYGAASPVRTTSLALNVASAYGVAQGGSGRYSWTVAVVQMEPYQRTGPDAPPRVLWIELSGGGPPTPTRPP
ncbi:MAG: hypothetical protein WBD79_02285, partial [Anaerolineae bacterium]